MKLSVVLAAILFATPAFAEDEPTTNSSELVLPGDEEAPAAPPAAEPPPAEPAPAPGAPAAPPAPVKARMSIQQPQRTLPRLTVQDDGEGRLEKSEDTVAGGKHFRIKTRA